MNFIPKTMNIIPKMMNSTPRKMSTSTTRWFISNDISHDYFSKDNKVKNTQYSS